MSVFGVTMACYYTFKISVAHDMANRIYRNPLDILLSDYRIRIQFVEEKKRGGSTANTERIKEDSKCSISHSSTSNAWLLWLEQRSTINRE